MLKLLIVLLALGPKDASAKHFCHLAPNVSTFPTPEYREGMGVTQAAQAWQNYLGRLRQLNPSRRATSYTKRPTS